MSDASDSGHELSNAIDILRQKTADIDSRFQAILVIVDNFEPSCLETFEAILSDESDAEEIRCATVLAAGKIAGHMPDGAVRQRLFDLLVQQLDNPDTLFKNYAVQALGMFGHETAAPFLIKALTDKSNTVFSSAAQALGRIGDPVVPYLIQLLQQGADDARCVAAWQLGELGAAAAMTALVNQLNTDTNPDVQALCIWALGEIGIDAPEVIASLIRARANPDPDVRLRAEVAIKKVVRHVN